ncbi:MAG: glycosyltransferase family 9 protein [Actinomycetota bacterium]|nr:glycosyltransferase family 9 protein [Actinomycetota bacterium]
MKQGSAKSSILAVRLDNEGDVLLTGPAIRALAARGSSVTMMCGRRGKQAASLLPGVADVIVYTACWIDPDPQPLDTAATEGLIRKIRDLRFDRAFIFTSFHQSPLPTALLLRMARIPEIAAISEDYPGSLLDVRHRVPDEVHEVQRALSLVSTLGYRLPPGDSGNLQILRSGTAVPDLPRGSYVVVHPGASVPARAWSPALHAELVRALASSGRSVVVTGGPDEVELTAAVSGPPDPRVVDLGGRTTMAELAEVLAGAEAVVVANTGPAHLAAAVGTPVVSLFAPTVPSVRWRPWGVPHVLLGDQTISCAGCRARVCPFDDHPCLTAVSVEDVLSALESLTGSPTAGAVRAGAAAS